MSIRVLSLVASAIGWLLALPASAADPALKCQSKKNTMAGTYALCRQQAEGAYALHGDGEPRTPALQVCIEKLVLKWPLAESKAASAGGVCPTVGDLNAVQAVIDTRTTSLAIALGGGTTQATFPATGQQRCWDSVGLEI